MTLGTKISANDATAWNIKEKLQLALSVHVISMRQYKLIVGEKMNSLIYIITLKRLGILLCATFVGLAVTVATADTQNAKRPHQTHAETGDGKTDLVGGVYQPDGQTVDVQQLMPHKDEFVRLDLNRDGYVSKSEARSEYALNDAFDSVDQDNNDEITVFEFKNYYDLRYGAISNTRPLKHLSEHPNRHQAFYAYDKNGDGSISIQEFSAQTDKGSDGIPDANQKKPSGAALKENRYDPDPK